jgi:hypothetical protein
LQQSVILTRFFPSHQITCHDTRGFSVLPTSHSFAVIHAHIDAPAFVRLFLQRARYQRTRSAPFAHAFRQHLTLGRNVLPPARLERRGV